MRYIVCPAESFPLLHPITGESSGSSMTWTEFVSYLFTDARVTQGIPVLDQLELRKELRALAPGVFHGVPDDPAKVLAEACNRPSVFSAAAIQSAPDFFRAFIDAPSKKPEAA